MQGLNKVNVVENVGHNDPISMYSTHQEWSYTQSLTKVNDVENVGHCDPISI